MITPANATTGQRLPILFDSTPPSGPERAIATMLARLQISTVVMAACSSRPNRSVR
jgi:molybdopterin-guanine dinucleotide biosynthesis protein A